jgi:predicted ATPase/class 3 adenylate cyclase
MAAQPTGTVTLLFSDIEGSTALLQRLGTDRYAEALDLHRRLLRSAFERHGGYEVDYEGDSFFVAFRRAEQAVAAAAAAQLALVRAEWSEGGEIRVRMGLHTGEPLAVAAKYVGLDVHKAARIMAAGHGGQVLLSAATQRLVDESCEAVALGEHRLKDLLQPEPLYQLRVEGLQSEFPALKTLGNRPTNLPQQSNPLIGRVQEVVDLTGLLRDPDLRLVTLTGPGGTGKTRLALQAAAEVLDDFGSGAFFVSLAPISDPDLVVAAVAQALALREIPGETLAETIGSYLEQKEMLLLLDNFEQVIDAAVAVAALQARCPRLTVMVTSRERLRLAAERVYAVSPLRLIDPAGAFAAVAANEAVSLFAARATAATGDEFALTERNSPVVAEICARLDGLPLAIELAAAWTPVLPPKAVLQRLEHRLPLLDRGPRDAEKRSRTLRTTIDWSYELLAPGERTLFALLAVFHDGCRLEAVEFICAGDDGLKLLQQLAGLVEKNLVQQRSDTEGAPRYWMFETIREYAGERLVASGGEAQSRERHAEYYLGYVRERFAANIAFAEIVASLEPEQANIRAALGWARDNHDTSRLAAAVTDLWRLWRRSAGQLEEGLRWVDAALPDRDELAPDERMLFVHAASEAWRFGGDEEKARTLKKECLDIAEHSDSTVRLSDGSLVVVHVLAELASMARADGNVDQARAYLHQSLALGGGPISLLGLSELALEDDELAAAREYGERALAAFKAVGNNHNYAATLLHLAEIHQRSTEHDVAIDRVKEALHVFHLLNDEAAVGWCFDSLANLAADAGEVDDAAVLYGAAQRFTPALPDQSVVPVNRRKHLPPERVEAGSQLTFAAAVDYAFRTAEQLNPHGP